MGKGRGVGVGSWARELYLAKYLYLSVQGKLSVICVSKLLTLYVVRIITTPTSAPNMESIAKSPGGTHLVAAYQLGSLLVALCEII